MATPTIEPPLAPLDEQTMPVAKPEKSQKAIKYDDPKVREQARRLLERCITDAQQNAARLNRDRADMEALMFYRGGPDNQWTEWVSDGSNAGIWQQIPFDDDNGIPDWVPRCCTNVYATKIEDVVSLLNQAEPSMEYAPGTDDDEDQASAEVAESAVPVLLAEIDYEALKSELNLLIALTNGGAVCYYYDTDERYGTKDIQALQCPECGQMYMPADLEETDACPDCGAPADAMQPAFDPGGMPIGQPYAIGKICAELYTSYEVSLPQSARSWDERKVPWILTHCDMALEDVVRQWPQAKDVVEKAGSQQRHGQTQAYARQMLQMSSPRTGWPLGQRGGSAAKRGVTVFRLQHDPITDDETNFPDGLLAVMIGDKIIELGGLPFSDQDGTKIKSIILRQYASAPGTPFGKPVSDDLVPLQRTRNRVESLVDVALMTYGSPSTWVPTTMTIEDELDASPGKVKRYRSHDGTRPTIQQAHSPSEGLYKRLEMIDDSMDKQAHLNAILSGQRPQGDPTLGEVQRLEERGMAAFHTPLSKLTRFEIRQAEMLLSIGRQCAWSPRFRKVMGENGQWSVEQFSMTELKGKVDIICEPSSAWPKSKIAQQMRLKLAVEMGAVMPAQDPEVADKIRTRLDLGDVKPSLDNTRKQIARELDRWRAATSPMDIQPPNMQKMANPQLHLVLKKDFVTQEGFEMLEQGNAPVAQAILQHIAMLEQMLQPPMPPGPPEKPDNRSPVEKGDHSAVDAAVQSGAISPAGATPPPQSPLQGAIDAGALTPAGAQQPPQSPLQGAIDAGALQPAGAAEAQQQMMQPPPGPSIDELLAARILTPVQRPPESQPPQGGGGY